jgi:hypothetical protein
MSNLNISNLNVNNSKIFTDAESLLGELNKNEMSLINGGLQGEVPVATPPVICFVPDEPIVCFAPEDM